MWLRAIAPACVALAFIWAPAHAQTAAETPPGPTLQIKPAWTPKKIHRSQLRPQLKPALVSVPAEDEDVYVPPPQSGTQATVQPVAQTTPGGQPVQLAAAQAPSQPAAAAASNLPPAAITDFVGKFLGAGIEVALAPSPSEPPRRMSQVEITGDANEFTVKWATMRIGANFKPETVKSSQQEITFRPSGAPGRYIAVSSSGQAQGQSATAELVGRTMVVTVNTQLPSGQTSIQRYERKLTESGMDVVFTRTEAGRLIRQVNLTLTRSGGSIWRGL